MRLLLTKILSGLLLIPSLAIALSSDREQPINIEANHAQMDDKAGVTQYKGDAILTQGTVRITGDIITFYYDDKKQLTKAIAEGNLATYKQVHKEGEQPVKAKALQMEYHARSQKIYLLGQGHVWQAGDEFSGDRIEYDISLNVVNAKSGPVQVGDKVEKSKGRVHIIIQPPDSKKTKIKTPSKPKPTKVKRVVEETTEENKTISGYPTAQTTTNLNIRTGPDIQYDKIGLFNPNITVMVLTKQKEWSQVRGEIKGKPIIGWVNNRYLLEN